MTLETANINTSKEAKLPPSSYALMTPPSVPERLWSAGATALATASVATAVLGALLGGLYTLGDSPEAVQRASRRATIGALEGDATTKANSEDRGEIGDAYVKYDALMRKKQFPASLMSADYTAENEFLAGNIASSRRELQDDFAKEAANIVGLEYRTHIEDVVLENARTAFVTTTISMRVYLWAKDLKLSRRPEDDLRPVSVENQEACVDTWTLTPDGSWLLQKRVTVAKGKKYISMANDPEGGAPEEKVGQNKEALQNMLAETYQQLDEARRTSNFPRDLYTRNWEEMDATGAAVQRNKSKDVPYGYRQDFTASYKTDIIDVIPIGLDQLMAKVKRRAIWESRDGSKQMSGTRIEIDYWMKNREGDSWFITRTRHLTESPIFLSADI